MAGSSASPPRVLQVVLTLNPGGTERLVFDLASRLNAVIPMAVCCLDERGAWADDLEKLGIPVRSLGRRPGFQVGLGRLLARVAARHRATVLHAHQYSPFVYSALARLSHPGLRVIFTEHGRLSDRGPSPKRRAANQVLRRLATRVFAVSADVKCHLVAEGFRADSVAVIYNGIDVGPLPAPATRDAVRRELGVSDHDLVIGTIARLDPVKDLGTLLEAAAHMAAPVTLLIIGDGAERQHLEERARTLALARRVRFLGYRDDARRWLAGCDVFANSSISEGVSLTILEAMAAGLPVVATRVGGTPEVGTDECGVLVPSQDAAALAGALGRLAEDPALRHRLGAAARRRVESRFTLDRMIAEYRRVYESAAPA